VCSSDLAKITIEQNNTPGGLGNLYVNSSDGYITDASLVYADRLRFVIEPVLTSATTKVYSLQQPARVTANGQDVTQNCPWDAATKTVTTKTSAPATVEVMWSTALSNPDVYRDNPEAQCRVSRLPRNSASMKFTISGVTRASLKIYTNSGMLVRTLDKTGAAESVVWDGKNGAGKPAGTGGYFYRVTSKNRTIKVGNFIVIN
jgi:hypothetical protein